MRIVTPFYRVVKFNKATYMVSVHYALTFASHLIWQFCPTGKEAPSGVGKSLSFIVHFLSEDLEKES